VGTDGMMVPLNFCNAVKCLKFMEGWLYRFGSNVGLNQVEWDIRWERCSWSEDSS
jgi:hypothetical protein